MHKGLRNAQQNLRSICKFVGHIFSGRRRLPINIVSDSWYEAPSSSPRPADNS